MGCRQAAPRSELARFATVEGRVVRDPAGTLPGRGAWLHPSRECLDRALARKAFQRAFRTGALELPATDDTVD